MKIYELKVTDNSKTNNPEIIITKDISAKHFMDIKEQAETILENELTSNNEKKVFNQKIDISLINKKNESDIHKMVWNKATFSDGEGYFKGWSFFNNGKQFEDTSSTFKNKYLGSIILMIFLLASVLPLILVDNLSKELRNIILLYIFFVGMLNSTFSPVFRSNFNDSTTNIGQVLKHNIILELPVWITSFLAIFNLYKVQLFEIINISAVITVTIIYLMVKIGLSIFFDIEKLSARKEKK